MKKIKFIQYIFENYKLRAKTFLLNLQESYFQFRPLVWFIFVDEFIFDFHLLEGESMIPTFKPYGEVVILYKLPIHFYNLKNNLITKKSPSSDYKKGEIICLINPTDNKMQICKRILFLEGERVKMKNGEVIIIPKNHLWVEGDNKENSHDSRRFGPVSKHLIVGKVKIQVWPNMKLL